MEEEEEYYVVGPFESDCENKILVEDLNEMFRGSMSQCINYFYRTMIFAFESYDKDYFEHHPDNPKNTRPYGPNCNRDIIRSKLNGILTVVGAAASIITKDQEKNPCLKCNKRCTSQHVYKCESCRTEYRSNEMTGINTLTYGVCGGLNLSLTSFLVPVSLANVVHDIIIKNKISINGI